MRFFFQGWAGTEFRSPFLERGTFFQDRKYRVPQIYFLRGSQSTAFLNPKKAVRSRSSQDRTKSAILALERAILLSNRSFV